ncbi:MAG: ATP-binding protein [Treponema sp.]|nr:ATP-binding protein [Treponema sp.]
MEESTKAPDKNQDPLKPVADMLFAYLYDTIYFPATASLDIERLPEAFRLFGKGMQYFGGTIAEVRTFAKELAVGNLNVKPPPPTNEIASSLKMLHSSLKQLTAQAQQVAKGDYSQRVNFMGDFSAAFNNMVEQLEQKRELSLDEKAKLEMYVHLILVNCPNPILLFDSGGKLTYVSESFFQYCTIFRRDQVLGKQIHEIFSPAVSEESLYEIEDLFRDAITEEHMYKTEQEIDFGNPYSHGHFEIQITPMMDSFGIVSGVIVVLFDVSDSMLARQEAERSRELAEQSSRAKSNFLAKMSHEIRTPMNAILGMTELALREDVPPSVGEHIRTIRQAGVNLLSIINDILDFSKIEAGRLEIVPTEYLFSSLIQDVINIIKTRALESRLRFVTSIDCNIPSVLFGDEIKVRQIFLNLLSNAVKYTEKGFISLSVRGEPANNYIVNLIVEVTDSGRGIKQEEMGNLFGEFNQLDLEGNRGVEGTGLGLAICRSLAAAMGGKIEVVSEYGKGSTFTATLPQKVCNAKKLASVENAEKKNVLVYERRDIYANSIVRTMENLGVNCKLVTNSSDFFNCLVSRNYSFVFLASTLYDYAKKKYAGLESDAKFAVIAEFGEAITDHNISTLTMPVFSISVANFLNGVSDNYAGGSVKGAVNRFVAPDAKVLVVDDINTNLDVAEGLLLPYKTQVTLCRSGTEAVEEIKSSRYDLVLMDNMMPDMNGISAVALVRELNDIDSYYKNLPIVALTADAVYGTRELLLENGFDDFLSKPIDTVMLNGILEKWIPKEKQKDPAEQKLRNSLPGKHGGKSKLNIKGLNVEKGIARTGGKKEKYLQTLSTFYNDGVVKIREIKACLENGNISSYVINVHAIKSIAGYIGADKLSAAAAALEDAGKKKDLDFIHTYSGAFLADLEALLQNINIVLSEEAEKEQSADIDNDLLKSALVRLKTALESFDSAEINKAVDTLQNFTQASFAGDTVSAILQNRLIGEYDEALSMIDNLMKKLEFEEAYKNLDLK